MGPMAWLSALKVYFHDYLPMSLIAWREGYSRKKFISDLTAGATVGVIALPLAMAFAISSGVAPEKGLFTAVIAGFLISLLGGSRHQIGGPTGAFVVVIYSIVERHGYEGLALATLLAGLLLILFALFRAGSLLKYIPYPVIIGFTTGIALVLFTGQMKDFFGLPLGGLPPDFIGKWTLYFKEASHFDSVALGLALATLFVLIAVRKFAPRLPAALIGLVLATLVVGLADLPLETIEGRYGPISGGLPHISWPHFPWSKCIELIPDILTIAMLAGIESLLSAVVADGMTGKRHRSNSELLGQGIANVASILFGGIPATGAIARTTANVQLGAKSPLSGMVHALTVLILMLIFAPLAGKVPLAALSAVLVMVAWNMSERAHFIEILKKGREEAVICLVTFFLTLLFDLTVAIQVGVVLGALLFMRQMGRKARLEVVSKTAAGEQSASDEVVIFEVEGPLFFAVAHELSKKYAEKSHPHLKAFILSLEDVPLIDSTGMHAISDMARHFRARKVHFFLSGISGERAEIFKRYRFDSGAIFEGLEGATSHALALLKKAEKSDAKSLAITATTP